MLFVDKATKGWGLVMVLATLAGGALVAAVTAIDLVSGCSMIARAFVAAAIPRKCCCKRIAATPVKLCTTCQCPFTSTASIGVGSVLVTTLKAVQSANKAVKMASATGARRSGVIVAGHFTQAHGAERTGQAHEPQHQNNRNIRKG